MALPAAGFAQAKKLQPLHIADKRPFVAEQFVAESMEG